MTKEATLQDDPNVKLPAAVRAAAARSEQLYNALKDNPEITANSNPIFDPASKEVIQPTRVNLPPEQVMAPAEPQPEPQEAQPQPERRAEPDESWEHKYRSVHGRYTRAQEQIKELSDQITNLQNVIATMQTQPSSVTLPELQAERLITDDEARDYGEDFLKVVGKKAKEELIPIVKQYEAKIEELERRLQGVQGTVVQDSHAKLMATLDEKLPNWRDLNTNEDFLAWLRLPDTYSGVIRHEMLKAAYAQGDARRVLAFFNGFLAEEAAVAPAKAEPDVATERVAKVPLQNFAAPGRAKTAAAPTPAPAEKPILTRAQIAAFYADVAAGRYRGRDADKQKAEAMIFDAQREGRIR